MQNFLRISDAVSLAFHSLWIMAEHQEEHLSTPEIAKQLEVSEHHLQKVHQRLTKAGFIQAVRGPKGGFMLIRPAHEITLLEVFEAMEGSQEPGHCLLGREECLVADCLLGNLVVQVNQLVRDYFQKITIDQLVKSKFVQIHR